MIKDYIEKMQSENENKINDLEKEMQELEDDLSCAEREIEEIQQEKSLDANIFSPRAMNRKMDDQISEKQEKIKVLKQRMEYVTQMIEESMNIREEYKNLHDELEQDTSGKSEMEKTPQKEDSVDLDLSNRNLIVNSDMNSDDSPDEKRLEQNVDNPVSSSNVLNHAEILTFLDTIYHKTETSLALLNGNKNRCRTELRSCMKLIKDFAKKLENNSD